jgi:uncharacterized membrane protein
MQKTMPPMRVSKLVWLWLVAVVIGAGCYFRFVNLDAKVYWHDEVYTSLYMAGYRITEARRQLVKRPEINAQDVLKYQQLDPQRSVLDTIRALAAEDPVHPPLYFVSLRLWAHVFGSSVRAIRSLSALLSLLVFPCLYWLCCELFESTLTAWIAMMIVAVSPFHVFYAQEARQYSLLAAAILFASAALLSALRRQTRGGWIVYAAALIFGLYTHVLFLGVVLGHLLYVLGMSFPEINWKTMRLPRAVLYYLLATACGLVAFVPWGLIVVRNLGRVEATFSFLNRQDSVLKLVGQWGYCFGSLFVDIADGRVRAVYGFDYPWIELIYLPALILALYSIYFLYRRAERRTLLFVSTLVGTVFILLALPDLLMGTWASSVQRYLISSFLGVQLAVAHLFARRLNAPGFARRRVWQGLFAVLVLVGVVSCATGSRAEMWSNKGNPHIPQIARVVNAAPAPLVICSFGEPASADAVTLSYLLEPKVKLRMMDKQDVIFVPAGYSDLFLFGSPQWAQRAVNTEGIYRVEPVGESGLWRLIKN